LLAELAKHVSAEELGKLVTMDTDAAALDRTALGNPSALGFDRCQAYQCSRLLRLLAVLPLIADDSAIHVTTLGQFLQVIETELPPHALRTILRPHGNNARQWWPIQSLHEAAADWR